MLHVIVYDNAADDPLCRCRRWPVSDQFVTDIGNLAGVFAGPNDGKHIVLFSLDTEFQTYIEPHDQYNSATAWYYDRLQANLIRARDMIRTNAANALVSFSWGGWQTRWDDALGGGGRSMIPHFANTMRQMDFISFQAMQTDSNVDDILRNVRVFGVYNKHLMVSHYYPDNGSSITFGADVGAFFSQSFVDETRRAGLFAFSFMNGNLIRSGNLLLTCAAGINRFTD